MTRRLLLSVRFFHPFLSPLVPRENFFLLVAASPLFSSAARASFRVSLSFSLFAFSQSGPAILFLRRHSIGSILRVSSAAGQQEETYTTTNSGGMQLDRDYVVRPANFKQDPGTDVLKH